MSIFIATNATGVEPSLAGVLKEICRRAVDGTIDRALKHKITNTADSSAIASTTDETAFSVTQDLSAGLYQPGRIFRLTASGVFSTTGTPTLQFRVKIGTTTIVEFTAQAAPNNSSSQPFLIQAEIITRSLGATGTVMGQGRLFFGTSAAVENVVNAAATTVNTTTEQTINVTADWSANSSSNTTTLKTLILELSDY